MDKIGQNNTINTLENILISTLLLGFLPVCLLIPKQISFVSVIIILLITKKNINIKDINFNIKKNLPEFYLIFFFIFFIFFSTLWSIRPFYTFYCAIKLLFIFILGISLNYSFYNNKINNKNITPFIVFGLSISSSFLYLNYFLGGYWEKLTGFSTAKIFTPYALTLSILMWPFLLYFLKSPLCKKNYILFFFSLFVVGIIFTDCDTAIFNIIIGGIFYILVYKFKNKIIHSISILFTCGFLTAPLIANYMFEPKNFEFINSLSSNTSYLERVKIYYNISNYILKKPIEGYGFHTSRFLPFINKHYTLIYTQKNGIQGSLVLSTIPLHPHNFFLEIWVELGFFGVYLFCIFFSVILYKISKITDRQEKSITTGFLLSILSTMTFSLSIWQTWWIFVIFIACWVMKKNLNNSC